MLQVHIIKKKYIDFLIVYNMVDLNTKHAIFGFCH